MQMPWLGKGGNAIPQPKMQTLQNKIWTILFVYAVLYISVQNSCYQWGIVIVNIDIRLVHDNPSSIRYRLLAKKFSTTSILVLNSWFLNIF